MKQLYNTKRKKWPAIIVTALIVVAVVGIATWSNSTAWERDLSVKYIDYVSNEPGGSNYYLYEITNNTNRTLRSVTAEVEVLNGNTRKWTFEDRIGEIKVGETKEYKIYVSDMEDSARERGEKLSWSSADIKRISYN